MTLIVNKLPEEIWQMDIPLTCKVIAERICSLTKNGEKECFVSNAYLVNILGIGEKTVQRSLELLQDSKIIDIKVTRRNNKKVRLVYFIFDVQNCQNDSIKTVKKTVFSIQSNDHISNDISNDQQTNTSSSQSHTQFSIEKIENDALYLQNIFTEEIMKLAKRNIEARNVSSFVESEKWLKWNRQNDKLKFIKSEKRLRELVSSWVLKSLENVVTHPEVINQEDLTEKRQAFLASLKY